MSLQTATISGQFISPDLSQGAMTVTIEAVSDGTRIAYAGKVIAGKTKVKIHKDGTAHVTLAQIPQTGLTPPNARWRLIWKLGNDTEKWEFYLTGDTTWDALVDVADIPVVSSIQAAAEAARDLAQGYAASAAGSVSLVAWAPLTAYLAGDVRQAPDGSSITRNANGTSTSTFAADAANWTATVIKSGTVAQTGLANLYLRVNESPLSPFHPHYGADTTGTTDITTIVQQVMDDAFTSSGSRPVSLNPGRTTGGGQASHKIQQIKLNQGQVIDGGPNGMFTTRIVRQAGASGPFIREKTPGEGGGGAQGVSIRNLFVDCNSVTGDGINIGNQGGADWGFNGVLENVHVRNATADGFSLNADAVTGWNMSAYFNGGVGFKVTGHGDNNWFQVSTSRNGVSELDLSGAADSFFGLHIEPGAVTEAIIVRNGGVLLEGLSAFPYGSVTDLVQLVGGSVSGFTMRNVLYAQNGGFTLTNWVNCGITPALSLAAPGGTGNVFLREWSDNNSGFSYIVNIARGTQVQFRDYGQVSARGFFRTGLATGKTANYTVLDQDSVVMCAGTGGFTITLPAGNLYRGREITVVNKGSGSITIAATSGTVDTTTLAATTGKATYISDGTNWITIA